MNSTARKNLERAERIARALDKHAGRSRWSDPADVEVSYHVSSGEFIASAWVTVNGRDRRWEATGETVAQSLNALEIAIVTAKRPRLLEGGRR